MNLDDFSNAHFHRALEDYRNELLTIYTMMVVVADDMNLLPDRRYTSEAASLDKLSPNIFRALLNRARHYSIIEDRQVEKRHRVRPFAHRYLHPASSQKVQDKASRHQLMVSMRKNANLLTRLRAKVREINRTESAVAFKRAFNEAWKLTGQPHGVFSDPPEDLAPRSFLTTPTIRNELERFGLTPEKLMAQHPVTTPGFLTSSRHLKAEY